MKINSKSNYISVESHYNEISDAKEKDDAIMFEMGHIEENGEVIIDNIVLTNIEDARKFAESIFKLCDKIEGGES